MWCDFLFWSCQKKKKKKENQTLIKYAFIFIKFCKHQMIICCNFKEENAICCCFSCVKFYVTASPEWVNLLSASNNNNNNNNKLFRANKILLFFIFQGIKNSNFRFFYAVLLQDPVLFLCTCYYTCFAKYYQNNVFFLAVFCCGKKNTSMK